MKNFKITYLPFIPLLFLLFLAAACGTSRKVKVLNAEQVTAKMVPSEFKENDTTGMSKRVQKNDTIKIESKNKPDQPIMAYRSTDGEVFAEDELEAVIIESTFKNVAERNGKVDLWFQITVPRKLTDSKWQLRFYPWIEIMGDREEMEQVYITGVRYREDQMRGYQLYDRFVGKIINDSTTFVDRNKLDLFLERNMPQIYAYKSDTSFVSADEFYANYGVSEKEAVDHYTNKMWKKRNENRKNKKSKKFAKYVKIPIVVDSLRLDTVINTQSGDLTYLYCQTITTRPKLKKAQISMVTEVYDGLDMVYKTPQMGPIDFYISSISAFVDNLTVRYLTKVIERRATDNKEYQIDFKAGRTDLDLGYNNNTEEIGRVKKHLASLIDNQEYDLDSIIVSASASPDGRLSLNKSVSQKRSESIVNYFKKYVKFYKDSVERAKEDEGGFEINLDSTYVEGEKVKPVEIVFTPRSIPEDWERLRQLIIVDTVIPMADKEKIFEMYEVKDLDAREVKMRSLPSFKYIKSDLYTQLRDVTFRFFMHRKGMVKDTVHTTIIDSTYMNGVQALRDMDYEKALVLLAPYQDYNTAVCYTSMNRNISALQILDKLERTDQVNYLLAIINAREGNIQEAVSFYMDACRQNPQYIHRGNLDPEISELIKGYKLHDILYKEEEEELMGLY